MHHSDHFIRRRELTDRSRQVIVWPGLSANHTANDWQHATEVKSVGFADDAAGFAEFQNTQLTAGFEDAVEFFKSASVIDQVTESKRISRLEL